MAGTAWSLCFFLLAPGTAREAGLPDCMILIFGNQSEGAFVAGLTQSTCSVVPLGSQGPRGHEALHGSGFWPGLL